MQAHEYHTLFDYEETYWWYRALRGMLVAMCRQLGLGSSARILDAGCGTGKTVQVLRERVSKETYGFDLSEHAARYWPQRRLQRMCLGSINAIPFQDESFDVAISVDVLECESVVERQACRELWRVVRPEGYLILVVPAYQWMMTPQHHRAVQACRRYSRGRVRGLLSETPGRLVRMTHYFMSLFVPIALYRLGRRFDRISEDRAYSELRPLPRALNEWLFRVADWERRLVSVMDVPVGSSIIAVMQKAADPTRGLPRHLVSEPDDEISKVHAVA